MKIPFICVNYNNATITRDYILNVLNITGDNQVKIIIVDNASDKDDVNALAIYIENLNNKDLILLKSPTNVGYFGGLNIGIKWALQHGYNRYHIIGNNDLEFTSDFLNILKNLKIKENELVLAPDVVTNEGIHENPHVIFKMSFLRKLKYKIYFSNYYLAKLINNFVSTERKPKAFDPVKKHIHMGIGALYVLTPNFFTHFKALWNPVFLYGEEAILAGQVDSVNGKILYEPLLKCLHNESATTSKMDSKYKYHVIQSSFKIYKKYL